MVTVIGYRVVETDDNDTYIRLILSGDLTLVRSKETVRHYATVRKCSISSTFDEHTAKLMVGKQLSGSIIKEDCEEYEYTLENGESVLLSHRWTYTEESEEDLAIKNLITMTSSNGTANSKAA